jgi:hypothetical protein
LLPIYYAQESRKLKVAERTGIFALLTDFLQETEPEERDVMLPGHHVGDPGRPVDLRNCGQDIGRGSYQD